MCTTRRLLRYVAYTYSTSYVCNNYCIILRSTYNSKQWYGEGGGVDLKLFYPAADDKGAGSQLSWTAS